MNVKDLLHGLKEFWNEFKKVKSGMVGLFLLVCFIVIVFIEPLLLIFPETNKKWQDIIYWSDNPQNAPPVWTNYFSSKKATITSKITKFEKSEEQSDTVKMVKYLFKYKYEFDKSPLDVIIRFSGQGNVPFILSVERPDGKNIELYRSQAELADGFGQRVSMDKDTKANIFEFLRNYESEDALAKYNMDDMKPSYIIFNTAEEGMMENFHALKGDYKFILTTLLISDDSSVKNPVLIIAGNVSGYLGTDNSKRDIFCGIIAGVKWALLIGLLTSFLSITICVAFGVISAYLGGGVDSFMQRVNEFFLLMPLLPFLIVLSAIFKPTIWSMIGIMCLFFWSYNVKTVRSIALQIKEETYIEASKAMGAKKSRIIFKHIIPILVPYAFAAMALYVPLVIVYESTVSLLGLGDSSIVTWGQILHDALSRGAVINGIWWWVVPPGLMISIMGMTFAFIGFAMDKILNPKLKTR